MSHTNNNNNLVVREIEPSDFSKGYLELLQSFASFYPKISEEEFKNYLTNHETTKIVVIEDISTNKIVGGGTIFCLDKLHNNLNRMGFIQDVVVEKSYRKQGLGKILVDNLFELGKANKCYKTILNCNPDVEQFYTKIGFTKKGFEFDKR